ncbi:hypothetical protein GCM10017044_01010 [Kordiimonas sediminis]|uniref:DJ-1/PfpI domain-containing protein n=1 Tax=Kordiimonas sediminis TaxID=1735581 RepID=A0A919AL37_9PROT|nr:nuclear transport factor 2 family protein [Kordiimonas sediminis]GHF11106.1 hypothetical protein GCM10017044_01010 [Kordiimonas sediminis]
MTLQKIWMVAITALAFLSPAISASDDRAAIRETLIDYIEGTATYQPDRVKDAFHPEATLYLARDDKPVWLVAPEDYASWFSSRTGDSRRVGDVISIDIENDIATAKASISVFPQGTQYIDMFLLKKIEGDWKIISKSATALEGTIPDRRVLFIMSNADYHGDTNRPTGVSFAEIVKAYDVFRKAGYAVDFVTPTGGAIPLAYINTSETIQKDYLYDKDLMARLSDTASPDQIDAGKYQAVHYVGGGNAMYGVADNAHIQKIAMHVYEQNKGIISSVCHGTAGIAFLKEKDGSYLVSGKRVSGYPDAFERQDAEYYLAFPFKITETISAHGGDFRHAERNVPHVEIDGRLITGQNHLSSAAVAQAIIDQLDKGTN